MPRLVLVLIAPTFLGAACETWPLFAQVPEEDPGPGAASILTLTEEDLPEGTMQAIGVLDAPAIVTIEGATSTCGFDPTATWPEWPAHPVDVDGDGAIDTEEPRFSGWFTGDTDLFSIEADEPV